MCVQQFLLISKVRRDSVLHSPTPRAHHPHPEFPAFLAFLSQSILHQQLEKPTKLQELQGVSGLDGGWGDRQGRAGLGWGWRVTLAVRGGPLEPAAVGGDSKPLACSREHLEPGGWAGPTPLRCGQLPPGPFDVTEMETHTCPTIN